MSRICVFGAGAIGGYVGARLALKGEADVSLVARGAHLAAMKANGLTLRQAGETHVVHPRVTDDPPSWARRTSSSSPSRRMASPASSTSSCR